MFYKKILLILQIIVTATLVIATIIIGSYQSNILKKQVELYELTTTPYDPELRVWSGYVPIELSTQDLLKEMGQRARVKICMKNRGQTPTGHIYAHWENNWTHNRNPLNIHPWIEPGETNCTWLELTAKECWGDPDYCTEEIIPKGWTDLNLFIKCDGCLPPKKEFNKTFRACVWENTSRECEE